MADRNEAKALLARAGVEINNALRRVDSMDDDEVGEITNLGDSMRAFFDKNGSCGAASVKDLRAFFDKNGSCSGRAPGAAADLVTRPFYFDAIREVLKEGNLARMKRVSAQAKDLMKQQGDLLSAITQLDEAIRDHESR